METFLSVSVTVFFFLFQDDESVEVEVTRLQEGGYFGELALVTHKPRAASVYAVGPTSVACKLFVSLIQIPILSLTFSFDGIHFSSRQCYKGGGLGVSV